MYTVQKHSRMDGQMDGRMDGFAALFICCFPSGSHLHYCQLSFSILRPCISKSIHLFKGMCSFYLSTHLSIYLSSSYALFVHTRPFITEADLFVLSAPDCTHASHESDMIYPSRLLYASISVSFLFLCKEKSLYKRTASPRRGKLTRQISFLKMREAAQMFLREMS